MNPQDPYNKKDAPVIANPVIGKDDNPEEMKKKNFAVGDTLSPDERTQVKKELQKNIKNAKDKDEDEDED